MLRSGAAGGWCHGGIVRKKFLMSWFYLILAGLLEIGWPVGLKIAQNPATRVIGVSFAVIFMAASGFMLWLAQRTIPIGTAYAVWTGIGAAGTFLVGVVVYRDPASVLHYFGIVLILSGVFALKLAH
jgi:quaternary ammonium compound-resistance protein SugE